MLNRNKMLNLDNNNSLMTKLRRLMGILMGVLIVVNNRWYHKQIKVYSNSLIIINRISHK
jgi:hypothetical protein